MSLRAPPCVNSLLAQTQRISLGTGAGLVFDTYVYGMSRIRMNSTHRCLHVNTGIECMLPEFTFPSLAPVHTFGSHWSAPWLLQAV
jgi:hypothetical protein